MRQIKQNQHGFTLVEMITGLVVLSVSILGVSAVFIANQRTQETTLEEGTLAHAFRRTVEQMRGDTFADVVDLYDGYTFNVSEIGGTGTVTVITDETATVAELGLPRDLDGDGSATNVDVSASYLLLPVKVDISWDGNYGTQTRTLYTFLSEGG
ncbi:MAG: type II secretion system protein [Planctomycetota bacterium]